MQAALKRHGITYPVAQDNHSQTWNADRNRHWPAHPALYTPVMLIGLIIRCVAFELRQGLRPWIAPK